MSHDLREVVEDFAVSTVRDRTKKSLGQNLIQNDTFTLNEITGDYLDRADAVTFEKILDTDLPNEPVTLGGRQIGTLGDSEDTFTRNVKDIVGDAKVPERVQKALGQDPSNLSIDNFNDALKLGISDQIKIGKEPINTSKPENNTDSSNFEGPLPGPDPDNSTMNQELENGMGTAKRVKSVIEDNTSLIIVSFFILGAIGVSLGPLDFE